MELPRIPEGTIGKLRVAPRAEKTAISEALEAAFARLKAAKTELLDAEALLSAESS